MRAGFKVLCKPSSILSMSLGSQTKSFDSEEKLLGGKWTQTRSNVPEHFYSDACDEGRWTKCLPVFESMVRRRWLNHLREPCGVFVPVELAAVDDNTADRGAVSANPLGCGVHDNVCTVLDGSDIVPSCSESVVNLEAQVSTNALSPASDTQQPTTKGIP